MRGKERIRFRNPLLFPFCFFLDKNTHILELFSFIFGCKKKKNIEENDLFLLYNIINKSLWKFFENPQVINTLFNTLINKNFIS